MADTGESVAAGDAKDEALLPSVVLQALSSVRMPIIARMSKTGRTFPLVRGAFILAVEDFKLWDSIIKFKREYFTPYVVVQMVRSRCYILRGSWSI